MCNVHGCATSASHAARQRYGGGNGVAVWSVGLSSLYCSDGSRDDVGFDSRDKTVPTGDSANSKPRSELMRRAGFDVRI